MRPISPLIARTHSIVHAGVSVRSNRTPHPDAREAACPMHTLQPRAGERGR